MTQRIQAVEEDAKIKRQELNDTLHWHTRIEGERRVSESEKRLKSDIAAKSAKQGRKLDYVEEKFMRVIEGHEKEMKRMKLEVEKNAEWINYAAIAILVVVTVAIVYIGHYIMSMQ